jgi:hypothetical protein
MFRSGSGMKKYSYPEPGIKQPGSATLVIKDYFSKLLQ